MPFQLTCRKSKRDWEKYFVPNSTFLQSLSTLKKQKFLEGHGRTQKIKPRPFSLPGERGRDIEGMLAAAWEEGPDKLSPPTMGTRLDTERAQCTFTAAAAAAAAWAWTAMGVAPAAKAATLTEAWLNSLYTHSPSISRLDTDSDKGL